VEDHRTRCLKHAPVVTKGMARSVFTVFYPLIGKIFETEIKKVYDKLQPFTTYDELTAAFQNVPFEKE